MTPRSLFWIPVLVRFMLVWGAGLAGWYLWDFTIGLAISFIVLTLLVIIQLRYMYQLSLWLDQPEEVRLGDGWGSWTEIFAKLYRLRRDDERSRNELAEWLSRFRQAMSQLPDGVVIMDDVLFLEWCNPVAEQHLGLSMATDKGMRVTNLVRSPEFIDYIILGRYDEPLTLKLDERRLIVRLIPFENRRQILVTHDVTDMDRIEQMRRDFIANASHELRTPLTILRGNSERLIAELPTGSEAQVRMRLIGDEIERLIDITEKLLLLSRADANSIRYDMERVSLSGMMTELALDAMAFQPELQIRNDVEPNIDWTCDHSLVQQLLFNLYTNAAKYNVPNGWIRFALTRRDDRFVLSIENPCDNIPADLPERAFQRFYRGDASRGRRVDGVGLGLSLCSEIARLHKATLSLQVTERRTVLATLEGSLGASASPV